MKVYIETSAILYLLADSEPYKKDRTIEMYEQLAGMDVSLLISQIVNLELSKAPPILCKCIGAIMEKKKIAIVPLAEEHTKLAYALLGQSILPENFIFEALHLATAYSAQSDLFISWDFEHLFNAQMLFKLKGLAQELKLYPMSIGNPEMLLRSGFNSPKTLSDVRNMRTQAISQIDMSDIKKLFETIKKGI